MNEAEAPPPKKGFFKRLFSGKEKKQDTAPDLAALDASARLPKNDIAAIEIVYAEPQFDVTPLSEASPIEAPQNVAPATHEAAPILTRDNTHIDTTPIEVPPALPTIPAPIETLPPRQEAGSKNWWQRLKTGLGRSSTQLGDNIKSIFLNRKLNEATLEDFEDSLIGADLGSDVSARITANIRAGRYEKNLEPEQVKGILAAEIEKVLLPVAKPLLIDYGHKPYVILMVGVNGAGKTTTIGKLAAKFSQEGAKVMLAAGDTFRAAAVEQLQLWGKRVGAPVISGQHGADAAGLAFDAIKKAQAEEANILLIDTAGRLQNKAGLMEELSKIIRVIKKYDATAPHATLLVLDATVGQNGLSQVELFQKTANISGLIMTKLDGTARGGILVALAEKFRLPIHFIGVGEKVEDLSPFSAPDFAKALAGIEQ